MCGFHYLSIEWEIVSQKKKYLGLNPWGTLRTRGFQEGDNPLKKPQKAAASKGDQPGE